MASGHFWSTALENNIERDDFCTCRENVPTIVKCVDQSKSMILYRVSSVEVSV